MSVFRQLPSEYGTVRYSQITGNVYKQGIEAMYAIKGNSYEVLKFPHLVPVGWPVGCERVEGGIYGWRSQLVQGAWRSWLFGEKHF